ncbi:MAG: hypothetical protein RJB26_999, partial [Pseudomonadota bacterium]
MELLLSRRRTLQALAAATALPCLPGLAWADEPATASASLRRLIAASEAASAALEALPRSAPAAGAAAFTDPLGERYFSSVEANARRDLAGLGSIDRAALSATEQVAFEVLDYNARTTTRRYETGLAEMARWVPLDATGGLQVEFPDYVSGAGAPFANLHDYTIGLERLHGFAGYLNTLVMRLEQGRKLGYLQPKVVVAKVIGQLEAMLALPAAETPFMVAFKRFPATVEANAQRRLAAACERLVAREVLPAYRRLAVYLKRTYLPLALDAPGRCALKEGERLYASELQFHTTTTANAAELHATGLAEVARYRAGMEEVRAQVGFKGDLAAFFDFIRKDPQFYYTRPEDLLKKFAEIEQRIWAGMPRLFARKPASPFEVRPLPALGAQRGTGYYRPGPPDGKSPGVLWFNMAMLDTRPIPTLETLTLHEGIPGHHYQINLVLEDATLPDNLRFGGLTAYAEGWALYAESLGRELGMFTDPYQWFGHLDMAMLRAVRLVVDTGIHALGWERQRAIDYMLANTSMAPRDVAVEIDRYITWPGQACAYKAGE